MDSKQTADGSYWIGGRNVNDMRVVDLKEELEKRGLSKTGSKVVLLQRLVDHLNSEKLSNGSGKATVHPTQSSHVEDDIISQYKMAQQQALEEARKAADQARAGHAAAEMSPLISSPEPRKVPATPATEGRRKRRHNKDSKSEESGDDNVKSPKAPMALHEFVAPIATEKQSELVATGEPQEQPSSTVVAQPLQEDIIKSDEKVEAQLDSTTASSVATPIVTAEEGERTCGHGVQLDTGDSATDSNTSAAVGVAADVESEKIGQISDDQIHLSAPVVESSVEPTETTETISSEMEKEQPVEEELTVEEDKEELNFDEHIDESQPSKEEIVENSNTMDSNPEEKTDKPARRRKWGSSKPSQRAAVSISTDSLKGLIGSVSAAMANGASQVEEENITEDNADVAKTDERTPPKRIVVAKDEVDNKREISIRDEKSLDEIVEARTIKRQRITEEGLTRERSPSPARKPISCVLHLTGLTRPFTVKQLHELLAKFGPYDKQQQFWIDSKKSNCIVQYETEEEASKARAALHGVKWPPSNPRLLRADFTTQMELDKELGIKIQPVEVMVEMTTASGTHPSTEAEPVKQQERVVESKKRSRSREEDRGRKDRSKRTSRSPDVRRRRGSRSPPKQDEKKIWPVSREWDRGKETERPARGEERVRGRRSASPDHKAAAGKPEPPARLLDDLFRKTTTIPCIYWLPLTDDQILAREKERKAREAARREKIRQEEEARERQRNTRPSPDHHNRRR